MQPRQNVACNVRLPSRKGGSTAELPLPDWGIVSSTSYTISWHRYILHSIGRSKSYGQRPCQFPINGCKVVSGNWPPCHLAVSPPFSRTDLPLPLRNDQSGLLHHCRIRHAPIAPHRRACPLRL